MSIFGKPKYTIVRIKKKEIPEGLWTKCEECGAPIYNKTLDENVRVCPKCNFHFDISAPERLKLLIDDGTFTEFDKDMMPQDPLEFKGLKTYAEKLVQDQNATGLKEAVITGEGLLNGKRVAFGVTDSRFIMGSMGSVVGEKICRLIEFATNNRLPLVIVSGSGGGARMYEGMYSLMQMAKTSMAIARYCRVSGPYISVLTNPTMGGIMASFAGIGDVIVAEPRALLGFAGPRVIEQTIKQKLPKGFQRSEFMLDHGMVDLIIHRKQLKSVLSQLIVYLHAATGSPAPAP